MKSVRRLDYPTTNLAPQLSHGPETSSYMWMYKAEDTNVGKESHDDENSERPRNS